MFSIDATVTASTRYMVFRFAFCLVFVLLASLTPDGALVAQETNDQAALFVLSPDEAGTFAQLDADWQAALEQILVAEKAYLTDPFPYTLTAFDTYTDAGGAWALAVIVPSRVVDGGWEDLDLDQLVDVLLHRSPDGQVTGHVRTSPAFADLARAVPAQLIDYSPLLEIGPGTQAEAQPYLFPWAAGQTWWFGGSWHGGYGANALDFGPYSVALDQAGVLASAGGTLRMACQNDSEQRLLWIEQPNGERTGYLHLDRASVAAAVENNQLVGRHVDQGTFLGTLYRGNTKTDGVCPPSYPDCTFSTICGYGRNPHLHFVLPTRDITVDGISADAIGNGQAGDRFTSSNRPLDATPDVEPPAAVITWPISGSVTLAPAQDAAIAVELAVSDGGGSGVADVQVQLAWRNDTGSWSATEWITATTIAPGRYTAGFAACTSAWRVPHNRPLRISLQLADKAGNDVRTAEAAVYRYDFPDLNRDCVVEIKDLLALQSALIAHAEARPEYDVDGNGSVDSGDVQALSAAVFGSGPLHVAEAPSVDGATIFPGLGSRVIFSHLATLNELSVGHDVALSDGGALVVDWRSKALALVDLSTPVTLTIAGRWLLSDRILGVTAAGNLAYVSDAGDAQTGRMALLNTAQPPTQPLTPTIVAMLPLPGALMESALISDHLYVAAGYAGVHILDVANPQTPTLSATLDTPGLATDVSVAGNNIYVADQENGLLVYHSVPGVSAPGVSVPAPPLTSTLPLTAALVGSWDTPGTAIGVTFALSTAYVADGLGGVQILGVSDSSALRPLAVYTTTSAANSVVVSGTTLFVAAGWQGVLALDVSDPARPAVAGSFDTPGYAHDLALSGTLLLVADGPAGMQILQIAELPAPTHYLMIPFVANAPP